MGDVRQTQNGLHDVQTMNKQANRNVSNVDTLLYDHNKKRPETTLQLFTTTTG